MTRLLSHDEARAFYDRFGAKQDAQAWYEEPALERLVAHADFSAAQDVVEIGCGTGRFAERLLSHHLPPTARYTGTDLSATMIDLARQRLRSYEDRVVLHLADGRPLLPLPDASVDRVVSTYVLDLLDEGEIAAWIAEAHRVLRPNGRLAVCGLTAGESTLARWVTRAWRTVHSWRPALVGGCRPLRLQPYFDERSWQPPTRAVVEPYGLASEALVVTKRTPEA